MIKPKHFKPSMSAETQFARALRKVARHSAHIVEAHVVFGQIQGVHQMQQALREYSKLIDPWAKRQATKMLEKVSKSNHTSYQRAANVVASGKNSKEMGRLLRSTVAQNHVGEAAAALMAEQVELIKSIPIRAGERVQAMALEAVYNGSRASTIALALSEQGKVSESEAMCIARTEVARANTSITKARATAVGSRQYRWRNSGDESVREAHKRYEGQKIDGHIFDWDSPPTLDDGTTGHPGTFPNCRCYPEPVFDDGD